MPTVLNAEPPWHGDAPASAGEVGARLQKRILSLQGKFFAEDGARLRSSFSLFSSGVAAPLLRLDLVGPAPFCVF